MSISIMLCYARSGGTLLNKYLLSSDENVVLSEVNPIADKVGKLHQTISWQAKEWYGIEVNSSNYLDQIFEVYEWCEKNDKHLIIREWPYIDFVSCDLNGFKPSFHFAIFEMLQNKVELNVMAFVRDSIDVYLSSYACSKVDIDECLDPYSKYVEALIKSGFPYFKYERFCQDPKKEGKGICQALAIPHIQYGSLTSTKMTGDILPSRGNMRLNIAMLKRRYVCASHAKKINSNRFMMMANQALGYKPSYEASLCESWGDSIVVRGEKLINSVLFRFNN